MQPTPITNITQYVDGQSEIVQDMFRRHCDKSEAIIRVLVDSELNLTYSLTMSDSEDYIFIDDRQVYLLGMDEGSKALYHCGNAGKTTLYVNCENTALPEDQLQEFADRLSPKLPGITVVVGNSESGLSSDLELVAYSQRITQVWTEVIASV